MHPINMFRLDEELRFVDVSPESIRISPYCDRELGTLKDTADWLFCPYCGKKIFDEERNIILWGNEGLKHE